MITQHGKRLYFYLVLPFLLELVHGKFYPSILWNYQNPRFKEGIYRLNVLPDSKVNLICPHIAISLAMTNGPQSSSLYENFWIVDNSSFHSCNVNTSIPDNKILLRCEDPRSLHYRLLVFQSFTAVGGLTGTFKSGETYYFLSTANGSTETLNSTSRGHCEQFNMRLQIYICSDKKDVLCSEVESPTPFTLPTGSNQKTTTPTKTTEETAPSLPIEAMCQNRTNQKSPETAPSLPIEAMFQNRTNQKSPAMFQNRTNQKSPVLWLIVTVILGILLAVSLVLNLYFFRKHRHDTKPAKSESDPKLLMCKTNYTQHNFGGQNIKIFA
ncbi:ephrin-B2a-like isoform X6 [Montipora capricornis]|uniref:ephrin-B2a-like isoform X6 n=1 Tax=Montipora capricornis TaxID=246305 RepID=UPI0035F1542A